MPAVRVLVLASLVVAAVVLQVSVLTAVGALSYDGVVPNLALLLVVATGLVRGPDAAAVLGFVAGLALDVVPPADHVAGRWALALTVAGYLAGRMRQDTGSSPLAAVATVAACSFVGTSLYAFSGMLLQDPDVPVAEALRVVPLAVGYDVLLTPFVLPPLMRLLRRLRPREAGY
jgi:rod shape-determining protein MreD